MEGATARIEHMARPRLPSLSVCVAAHERMSVQRHDVGLRAI